MFQGNENAEEKNRGEKESEKGREEKNDDKVKLSPKGDRVTNGIFFSLFVTSYGIK